MAGKNAPVWQKRIETDAAQVLNSSTKAVKAILERRAELDRKGNHDIPLVVLAGEFHSIPSHTIHHVAVLNGLKNSGKKIAFGYEEEHNLLAQKFTKEMGRDPSLEEISALNKRDITGTLSLKTNLGFCGYYGADHTRAALFRFLLRHNIKSCFTDVSRPDSVLDASDPSTVESLRACFKHAVSDIDVESPEGVRVRNHHMVAASLDLARNSGARIVMLSCGDTHVAGSMQLDFSARHSLAAQFKHRGAAVMAMPIFTKYLSEDDIPPSRVLTSKERLYISELPRMVAAYDPDSDKPVRGRPATLRNRVDEATYTNALLARCGLKKETLSVGEYKKQQAQFKNEMRGIFKECEKIVAKAPAIVLT